MLHQLLHCAVLVLVLAPLSAAHDESGSTDFELQVPPGPYSGQVTFVTLIGPESGAQVLHTTWNITFESPPGGTPASDVLMELTLPLATGQAFWIVTGADFGWPSTTGAFSGSIDSDQLNGVLQGGLFPFTTPNLDIGATTGGLTGQFISSTIVLEIAGDTCQTDLGFGGPGNLELSLCGQPLASGNTAQLSVTGAASADTVYLVLGGQNTPTPFFGGTLVPVPVLVIRAFIADGLGSLELTVPGGGGPVTGFLQAVTVDGTLPGGYAISNALQVEFLP